MEKSENRGTEAEMCLQALQDYYTHVFTAAGVAYTRLSQLTFQHVVGRAHEPLLLTEELLMASGGERVSFLKSVVSGSLTMP